MEQVVLVIGRETEPHRFFCHTGVYVSGIAILLVYDDGHVRLDNYRQSCIFGIDSQQIDYICIDRIYGQYDICNRIDYRFPILVQLRPVLYVIQRVADCLVYVLVGLQVIVSYI